MIFSDILANALIKGLPRLLSRTHRQKLCGLEVEHTVTGQNSEACISDIFARILWCGEIQGHRFCNLDCGSEAEKTI